MTITQEERIDRLTRSVERIIDGLSVLSQEHRATAFDVKVIKTSVEEIKREQCGHGERLERIEREHGELLRAILERLGGAPARD